jgi:serine O-acetyltransferase
MQLSLPTADLKRYVSKQLENFLPDGIAFHGSDVDAAFAQALDRLEFCFRHITARGYSRDGEVTFSHLHTDQYCQFLYWLANSLWSQSQNRPLCDKLTALNRILNAVFLSYKVSLPDIFYMEHALGTVLGHAKYSNFMIVHQNVTVHTENITIEPGVFLSAGASLIGSMTVGARSSIGPDTRIYNRDIPADSVVFNDDQGVLQVRPRTKVCAAQKVFNVPI